MDAQQRRGLRDLTTNEIPPQPGVYAIYRDGEACYIGVGAGDGGLRRRIVREHLKQSGDLSRSAFRRNVGELIGACTVAQARVRPSILTTEQVGAVNAWTASCQIAWITCATPKSAEELERDMKAEWKPALTKR